MRAGPAEPDASSFLSLTTSPSLTVALLHSQSSIVAQITRLLVLRDSRAMVAPASCLEALFKHTKEVKYIVNAPVHVYKMFVEASEKSRFVFNLKIVYK